MRATSLGQRGSSRLTDSGASIDRNDIHTSEIRIEAIARRCAFSSTSSLRFSMLHSGSDSPAITKPHVLSSPRSTFYSSVAQLDRLFSGISNRLQCRIGP